MHSAIHADAKRRRFARANIQLDVSLYSDSNFYAGFTENLSVGGVFVATHNRRNVGDPVDVTITFPNEAKVIAHGVVRWLREYNAVSDTPPGMGIQFLTVDDEAAIEQFLAAREPLFHDHDE